MMVAGNVAMRAIEADLVLGRYFYEQDDAAAAATAAEIVMVVKYCDAILFFWLT